MKFDEFDKQMRVFEQSIDQVILPKMYMAARLDGRSFTRLTKEICQFEAPFDTRFRDMMTETVRQLMDCGFRVIYGFTQSDEISLLFHPEENAFGRKVRKYNSTLAGVASAAFSLQLGRAGIFDCRMIPLPTIESVRDYFLWRQEDAHRNALNAHCYWMLRKQGVTVQAATKQLEGQSTAYKKDLLLQNGIHFTALPNWQKRGIGVWLKPYEKAGFNPLTNEKTTTVRSGLAVEYEIPTGEAYADMIENFVRFPTAITRERPEHKI